MPKYLQPTLSTTPGPGLVDVALRDLATLREQIDSVDALAKDEREEPYVERLVPTHVAFHDAAERVRRFLYGVLDAHAEHMRRGAEVLRAVAEASAERVAMDPTIAIENRDYAKANERAKIIVAEQRRVADLVIDAEKPEGEKLARALVDAGRASAAALEWSIARYDAPLAIKRETLPIDVLTTMAAREKAFETRPSREILTLVRHVWSSAEEGSIEIEAANESALRIFNARVAMTPAEIAKAIGLRDGAARSGAIDKERGDAHAGLRALVEYHRARTPKSVIITRAEIMPLIVKVHTELLGTHARFLPRTGSVTDWPTERLREFLDPFALDPAWLSRRLPPSPLAPWPGWSPMLSRSSEGVPFRAGADARR